MLFSFDFLLQKHMIFSKISNNFILPSLFIKNRRQLMGVNKEKS